MMYSVRMRASKRAGEKGPKQKASEGKGKDVHISGAEGLYQEKEIQAAVEGYISRAFGHPRGRPDSINLAIEKISQKPLQIPSLTIRTTPTTNPNTSRIFIRKLLQSLKISDTAIEKAFNIVYETASMRGAAVIRAGSGKRTEPDTSRGIRVTRIGITAVADRRLRQELAGHGLDTTTVREALTLASKVAFCRDVVAELCISDDPDYTTGYVSSSDLGYVRIPHIKRKRSRAGGRVIFITQGADSGEVIAYLEKKPVMVSTISPCSGICSFPDFTGTDLIRQ